METGQAMVIALSAARGMMMPPPRPPLPTIPPPLQEPVRVEGMTDARGTRGPYCRCGTKLLMLTTESRSWRFDLALAVVTVLLGVVMLLIVPVRPGDGGATASQGRGAR